MNLVYFSTWTRTLNRRQARWSIYVICNQSDYYVICVSHVLSAYCLVYVCMIIVVAPLWLGSNELHETH